MNRFFLSLQLFLLFSLQLLSQNLELSIITIPDSLRQGANSVVRYENTEYQILSQGRMKISYRAAITVLNEKGNEDASIVLGYDKYHNINRVTAKIYNALGVEIKKVKRKEFKDRSAADGFSLYNDNRILYYRHIPQSYPYTLVYEYEITSSNTALIEKWFPVHGYFSSTQKSRFTIRFPDDVTVRNKEFNLENYNIHKTADEHSFSYELTNAKAIRNEPSSPSFFDFAPHVLFSANKFRLAGVDGSADNWQEFGQWIYDELLKGRDRLPESTRQEIINITKNIDDPLEKAKLVYGYMQEKTHYISVQIGIGGWKPMTADDVDRLAYGDCKALTNYTHSLLKAAGVTSYYTVLYAGDRRNIDTDLASIQGNHAILMVLAKKDTVWLECTSQKAPFGYLGDFTDDRDVFVVTPDGGRIAHTKSYSDSENLQEITGEYTLDTEGNISGKLQIVSRGIQYDDNYPLLDMDAKERATYYKDFLSQINDLSIEKISLKNDDDRAVFTENLKFSAGHYAVKSGDRLLLRLNAFNVNSHIPPRIRNRKQDLEIKYGYFDTDTVLIRLPEGYSIEALAKDKKLETPYGTYEMTIENKGDHSLKYTRKLLIKKGRYNVEDYDAYRKFRKKINQLDHSKIVLKKNSL